MADYLRYLSINSGDNTSDKELKYSGVKQQVSENHNLRHKKSDVEWTSDFDLIQLKINLFILTDRH